MSKMTFALYSYTTENIGDEVQSIAARYFLPRVDHYVDRDQLADFSLPENEQAKLIMNAWYMHNPRKWPFTAKNVTPLLVSMYVDQKNPAVVKAFKSPKSLTFLKEHGPVGARDMATLAFFESIGVPAYFSGCLTLTLQRDKTLPRQDFVLAVDVDPEAVKAMRQRTKRPVIDISVYRTPFLSNKAKFQLAEYYLYLYQSAHAVVTTRLHALLPSLAFETSVLLLKEEGKYEENRYKGLSDLARSATTEAFIKDPKLFNLDKPGANSNDYKKLREPLIKKCQAFTGYANPTKSFRTIDLEALYKNTQFVAFLTRGIRDGHRSLLLQGDVDWRDRIVRAQKKDVKGLQATIEARDKTIQDLERQVAELHQFKQDVMDTFGWKVNTKLHNIKTKMGKRSGENNER